MHSDPFQGNGVCSRKVVDRSNESEGSEKIDKRRVVARHSIFSYLLRFFEFSSFAIGPPLLFFSPSATRFHDNEYHSLRVIHSSLFKQLRRTTYERRGCKEASFYLHLYLYLYLSFATNDFEKKPYHRGTSTRAVDEHGIPRQISQSSCFCYQS